MKRFLITILFTFTLTTTFAQNSLRQGISAFENKDFEKALEYFNKCLDDNPNQTEALMFQAAIYANKEQYELALQSINRAIKNFDKKYGIKLTSLHHTRARIYCLTDDYDKAIEDLSFILKRNKTDLTTLNLRAYIYYLLDRYDASDADYQTMLRCNEASLDALKGLARNELERQHYESAMQYLNRSIKYNASDGESYKIRATIYLEQKQYTKAVDDIFIYLENDENAGVDLLISALPHAPRYILAKLNTRIAKDPQNLQWLFCRIDIYERQHQYAQALNDYNTILASMIESPLWIYDYRGHCYSQLGCYTEALADFNQILSQQPQSISSLFNRAETYRLSGAYQKALDDLTLVLELNPEEYGSAAYYSRGGIKEMQKNYHGALQDYDSGIELDPNHPALHLMRGRVYSTLGDTLNAQKDYHAILEQDTSLTVSSVRHYALLFTGQQEAAADWAEQIISLDTTNFGNYYDAACLYALMRKPKIAVTYLRQALAKGYRSFLHIETDRDLNSIRNRPDVQALLQQYRQQMTSEIQALTQKSPREDTDSALTTKVSIRRLPSGLLEIPCQINDLPLKLILDTGASTVSLSSVEALFMLKNGYLHQSDLYGNTAFRTASGDIAQGTKVKLRTLVIGGIKLSNIDASIAHNQEAPLLLGQSVLKRFGTFTIDAQSNTLTFQK